MPEDQTDLPAHGATRFRGLRLDTYGLDLPEQDDAATPLFRATDPEERAALDEALLAGAPSAARMLRGAIEQDAAALAALLRQLLSMPEWRGTQRVLVGGLPRSARFGAVAIARAGEMLDADGMDLRLAPLRHDSEAGLIGAARLLPDPVLAHADTVLAADLGDGCFRAGLVLPRLGVAPDLAAAGLWRSREWELAEEQAAPDRATAVGRLAGMLGDLAGEASAAGLSVAPVVVAGVPGRLDEEGRILEGAQGLPGDWLAEEFHLPGALSRLLPMEGGGHPSVLLHDTTVVQGLSEAPFEKGGAHWGVVTLGSRIGNARFTNVTITD